MVGSASGAADQRLRTAGPARITAALREHVDTDGTAANPARLFDNSNA